MGLNPKAPAWTPGPSSSGDRRGDILGRIRWAVHGVGTHNSVGGAKTLGVGGLNLPMKNDKPRANPYSQRVQQAINRKQIKRAGGNGRGPGLDVGLQGQLSTSNSEEAESGIGQGSNLQCQELVSKGSQRLWAG